MFGRRLIAQRGGVFAAMVAVNPGHRRRPPVSLPPVGRSRRWPREAGGAPHAWENRAVPLPGLLAIAGLIVWVGYGLVLAVYSWRINAEESMLLSTFGEQYAQYRRRTKRLIPFLY